MSFAFDEAYYLKSKLQQLIKTDAATYGSWSTSDVKDAIEAAGMTVEGHYQQYSLVEGTSGNPYFNTTEYLEAKLAQLKSVDPAQYNNWTVDDVVKAFQDAGFTSAEDHYNMYGCTETDANGYLINPSNAFDANAYVQAKLAQLMATDPETYKDYTAQDVAQAIKDAGMTPVDHFEEYGKAEGQASGIDMVQTVPVTRRVANDDLRDGMNENVPSNYNKPVDAPKDVTAAEAAENGGVDKPCDMATASKPADPVATPADSDYVAVPGGGITDTNENPVELVTAEVKDTEGNTVATASEYGVASTTTDAGGNTVKTVQPVDENGAVDTKADPIQTVTTSADGKTQTTETKVTDAQGNSVEVAEKVTTADDGSTVTDTVATATDADGNQTAKTETRVAADADGEVTGTNTSYTDESGKTSTDTTGEDPGTPDSPTPTPEPEPTPADSGSGATADTEAPTVTGVTVDGQTVTVQFSEKVVEVNSANTGTNVKYSIDGTEPSTSDVSGLSPALASDGKSYSFTLNSEPAAGAIVKVKIVADTFQDTSLNKMAAMDKAVASDPVPASGELTVSYTSPALTVSGLAKGDVLVDITNSKVTDNNSDVTVDPTVWTGFSSGGTTVDVSGVGLESGTGNVTIDGLAAASAVVNTSDLATTTVKLATAVTELTVGGSATKPASTVVEGLDGTDTAAGTFTAGEMAVTSGKIGLGTKTVKVFADANATYSGDITTVLDGADTLALDATSTPAAMDLSTITGFTKLDLDTASKNFEVQMTSSAYDTLVSTPANLSASAGDVVTLTDVTEIALGKFGTTYALNTAKTGTVTVGEDATYNASTAFGTNIKALNVTSGILTDANADSITKFDADGYSLTVASGATLSTGAAAVTLGGGTLSLGGTLALTGTTANTLNGTEGKAVTVGTLTSAAALTLDSKQAGADDGSSITVSTLTGKADGAALTAKGTVTASNVTNVNGVTGQDSATVDDAVSLTFKAGNDLALAVDMGTGGDKLTLSGDRGAATITVDNGDTVTGAITSGTANNVAKADVYTGLKAGDKITTEATFSTTTVSDQLLTDTNLAAAAVKGTYADGTFTASANGSDCLLQWADGSHDINSVVLVGVGSLTIAAPDGADITFAG